MKSGLNVLGNGLAGMTSLFMIGNNEKEKTKEEVSNVLDFEAEVSTDPLFKK